MTLVRAPDTEALEDALAKHLTALGLARYTPDGIYTATGLPAIFFGKLPDKPDNAILINTYNEDRGRDQATPDFYVQLRFRTAGRDKRTTDRLADAVFRELDDLVNDRIGQVWAGVNVLQCRRMLRVPAAQDTTLRYERPDSYRITTNPGEIT